MRKTAMIALSTLRRDKKAKILHLAEIHGCRNVRVFLWDLENLSGVEVDLVESGSVDPYIRGRVLAEAVPL